MTQNHNPNSQQEEPATELIGDLRMVPTDKGKELQELTQCAHCDRTEWISIHLDNRSSPDGWYAKKVTYDRELAFCPTHAQEGYNLTRGLSQKINQLIDSTLDGGRKAREHALRQIRTYQPPGGINPPGLYSQGTVSWLASLPSGKASSYWAMKRRMFPELTTQQGRMNFPDLIEMRAWTIMFRHGDMIWSQVIRFWHDAVDLLETPYPFSNPRFLASPRSMADRCSHPVIDHYVDLDTPRLARFRESLSHRGDMPVRWDLSRDLGLYAKEGPLDPDTDNFAVIAEPARFGGQPYIAGTSVTMQQVDKTEEESPHLASAKLGITTHQARAAKFLSDILRMPGKIAGLDPSGDDVGP